MRGEKKAQVVTILGRWKLSGLLIIATAAIAIIAEIIARQGGTSICGQEPFLLLGLPTKAIFAAAGNLLSGPGYHHASRFCFTNPVYEGVASAVPLIAGELIAGMAVLYTRARSSVRAPRRTRPRPADHWLERLGQTHLLC